MKSIQNIVFFILIISAICFSCETPSQKQTVFRQTSNMKYAKYFAIDTYSDYKLISLIHPWDSSKIYAKYVLYKNEPPILKGDTTNIQWVKIPSQRFVSLSSSFIEMIDKINEIEKIVAIDNGNYVYNKGIELRLKSGNITEIGEMQNINFEKLLHIKPDVLMANGWNVEFQSDKRIRSLGISVVYNLDWMEQTPLGRAEWIKFIAAFFDKDSLADVIFNDIELIYTDLKRMTKKAHTQPVVMHGVEFGGTWYMPGGNSYIANFYEDAGGIYCFADDNSTGSVPMNLESVINISMNANVWIVPEIADKFAGMLVDEKRYRIFKPLQTNRIYTNDKRISSNGANDFWDSGAANPHKVLADLISIFHPESMPKHELFYYRQFVVLPSTNP